MDTPKINLEKFNGKNDFNVWKVKMEALLVTQGLSDAIQPVTKKEEKSSPHQRLLSRFLRLIERLEAR